MDLTIFQAVGPLITAAATTTLAFLTFFSLRAARLTAREMYESRLARFRPLLYVVLKVDGDPIDNPPSLLITNVGPGPAMDIDVECDGDLYCRGHIAFFGSEQELELASSPAGSDHRDSQEVRVSVRFKDIFNNPLAIHTVYRYEPDPDKRTIFPEDTKMEGKFAGERRH